MTGRQGSNQDNGIPMTSTCHHCEPLLTRWIMGVQWWDMEIQWRHLTPSTPMPTTDNQHTEDNRWQENGGKTMGTWWPPPATTTPFHSQMWGGVVLNVIKCLLVRIKFHSIYYDLSMWRNLWNTCKPWVQVMVCHSAAQFNTAPIPITPVTKTLQEYPYLWNTLLFRKDWDQDHLRLVFWRTSLNQL